MALAAPAAHADAPGTLTFSAPSGADSDSMSVVTSGPCAGGTNLIMSVVGAGFPAAGINVDPNSPQSTYSQTANGGYTVPLTNTMQVFAQQNGITALNGQYTFTLTCRNAFGATTFGTFVGSIWFTTPTHYQSTPPGVTQTTTTLAVTPGSPVASGSPVSLTATVSPTAAGSVQFMDGANAVGTPVTVANGVATLSTSTLAVGAHSLSAVFTSTDPNFTNSTSGATAYTVSPAGVPGTQTSLAVTPSGAVTPGSAVTLTSTTTPAGAAGTVTFLDGSTPLGAPVTVTGGTATATVTTLAQGDHQLTASFTPADPTAFAASVSTAVPVTVSAPGGGGGGGTGGGGTGTENITTTVAPGALALSVAGSNVNLPPLTLNATSTLFAAAGPIQTVTVTDTRAGAPGWALSGQVANFASGANAINAENLGWVPNLVNKGDGLKVNLGGSVAPANGVAPSDGGALGLKTSRTLATATGLGTAQIGADLSLVAPTSTAAGTYTGVLTLTVM
jgi:hypothetical protein